jgi:hypothetical protein
MLFTPTRRQALVAMAATASAAAASSVPDVERVLVDRNDDYLDRLMKAQVTDPNSKWLGGLPDAYGLHNPGSGSSILEIGAAAFVHPNSRYHKDREVVARMRLAAGFLERSQSPEGNVFLLTTNYNSPPDTGFTSRTVCNGAFIARRYGHEEVARISEPFLRKAAGALETGGIHTPNHRWVVSSAMAQINDLYPDPRLIRRINQWLAESIDIDADGQYTERSTLTYNIIVDRSLIILASKLGRPELLDPVRRNLRSMLYLLHPGGEVVAEISHRQDLYERGDIGRYWFPLQYMAVADGDRQFATLAHRYRDKYASLAQLLAWPELNKPLPAQEPVPTDYEKEMPSVGIARIRRGDRDATLVLGGNSRFFTLRSGEAAINAVRFASAFFGKGQFVPQHGEKRGNDYLFSQSLEAGYYQPVDHKVTPADWVAVRRERRETQICRLQQSATVTETKNGFRVRIQSSGTSGVPLAVEVNFRDGGTLEGCTKSTLFPDTWLAQPGEISYRAGKDRIRFGPGATAHSYTQIRGAQNKLAGPSVYVTGYTPFDHTLDFRLD